MAYEAYDGNEFTWNGLTYKVVVRDYGGGVKLAWLDRNLGASQVATSANDTAAFGDLYQWGRLTDGHEKRTSGTITTRSTTDVPGHDDYIAPGVGVGGDWRSPANNDLWQGVDGINNPAPPGWRLPTIDELETERLSWSSSDIDGSFASPLKFTAAGARSYIDGSITTGGSQSYYWSSTISSSYSRGLYISASSSETSSFYFRAQGHSVRLVATAVDRPTPPVTPPDLDYININDLHISANPRLLFMANSITNKGRATKSYTIEIVNDKHNDSMLQGLFSRNNTKQIRFLAKYRISSITFTGWLLITGRDKWKASGVFISGNGALWEALQDKNLRDYDWTAYDHELTKANVIASESLSTYVYDIADRGEFKQDRGASALTKVDITERYPALSIVSMLQTILNSEGYGIRYLNETYQGEDINDYFLLFTQDKDIRNSKEWAKDALFNAITGGTALTDSGTGNGTAVIPASTLPATEDFDNGSNFNPATGIYTTPEAGTYRFASAFNALINKDALSTMTSATMQVAITADGTNLYYQDFTPDLTDPFVSVPVDLDTKYIHLAAGVEIKLTLSFQCDVTATGAWDISISTSNADFYNDTSRWYGEGSTVEISNVVPDISALDFLSKVFNYLNIYAYYRPETKTLEIALARDDEPEQSTLELVDIEQQFDERTNYWLRFATDKAGAPDDIYFDNSEGIDAEIKFDLSRTLISDSFRVFNETVFQVPVLWDGEDKSPLRWEDRYSPPAWKTKGNIRLLKYNGTADADYTLTYGGVADENEEAITTAPSFSEVDVEALHRNDLQLQGMTLTGTCRLDATKLKDQSLFKYPVWITGYGKYWLLEAEQINWDLFKLTLIK